MGEKTGWTYIEVPPKVAQELKPGNKRSFRVKGTINGKKIKGPALIPLGDGKFILVLNAPLRKLTGALYGSKVKVSLEIDLAPVVLNKDLLDCLSQE